MIEAMSPPSVASEARPRPGPSPLGPGGDLSAADLCFDEIYDLCFAFVWRAVRGLGVQEAVVDDAVQDVFVVVHRKFSDYCPEVSLRSWIFGITRRVASDYRRGARRKPTSALDESGMVSSDSDLDARVMSRQTLARVEQFLEGLDEENRALFVLVQVEGLSNAEAAEMLSLNPNTSYSRLKVMRQKLNALLASVEGVWEQ